MKPYDVPSFFPTSRRVVKLMLDLIDIKPGDMVLEPSAGDGALLDLLPKDCYVTCYEVDPALRGILVAKGYFPGYDFLRSEARPYYDVMSDKHCVRTTHVLVRVDFLKDLRDTIGVARPAEMYQKCYAR